MSSDRMLPTRSVCERYNISDRTVDRWVENGILSRPLRINGLRYWPERELEQREREFQRDDKRWPERLPTAGAKRGSTQRKGGRRDAATTRCRNGQ